MATHETWGDVRLLRAIADLAGDLTDLAQKEFRLARAEITQKFAQQMEAGIWFAVAGLLAFLVVGLLVEAAVFLLASNGIALHVACAIVAVIVATMAALAFYCGRAKVPSTLTPDRTARQLRETVTSVKEQLQ
jgi:hypothetical protein